MATYFHGNSEMQAADGLQTLILMNPAYVGYSENNHQSQNNNYVFLNSGGGGGNSVSPAANQLPIPHTQHFVGIPLPQESQPHEVSPFHGLIPRSQYNLWTPLDPNTAARETPRAQQGLSLSLWNSQQQKQQSLVSSSQPHQTAEISPGRLSAGTPSPASGISNGVSGMQSVLLSSKYLKVAQELLDEFVHMGKNFASKSTDASKKASASPKVAGESSNGGETSGKQVAEVSAAERQEIQMKKAKLLSLLDEVEQRYRQYHHQMQIVISSFEQAAGVGSARTYTSLALKTISKQFRCLKDTILSQLKSANKSLGEDDGLKIEGSRLKFVDHQLRQQRALQQLGMIQHNAWRPQRGLPERSVSVLRAWLFEHFLHPYPKDSDKLMLAKQTGLTRSQVSNWFINARVRLWKPMVEEMYSEEMKEHEQNGSEARATKSEQNEDSKSVEKTHIDDNYQSRTFKSNQDNAANKQNASTMSTSSASPSSARGSAGIQSGFNLIGSSELEGITQSSPKKLRGDEMLHFTSSLQTMNMDMKTDDGNNGAYPMGIERQGREGYAFMGGGLTNFIGGFGSYPMPEIGRFDAEQFQPRFSGNGVSLTLGLPDGENLSLSGNHQSFLPGQNMQPNEFGALNTPTSSHSAAAYENMNIQNRKRFATQMPDFMA